MSTVEIETGQYITRWAFWNPATWSIPKLYWDAWSQEQRIHAICRQLEKVIKYADYIGVNVDDIAARLKAIEEGQLDPIIEAAIEAWFEEHEPEIASAIEQLQEDVQTIVDEIGTGFDSENTISKAIADETLARETQDASINEKLNELKYKMRGLDFNCRFRNIVTSNYGTSYVNSCQGMTMFEMDDVLYLAQGILTENASIIILYDYATGEEVTRTSGSWGHLNDLTYRDGVVYALDNETRSVHLFNTNGHTISFDSTVTVSVQASAIGYNSTNDKFYLVTDSTLANHFSIVEYDAQLLESGSVYNVPFGTNPAIVQSIATYGNRVLVATAEPNVIVYYNIESGDVSYWNAPTTIGFCDVSEIEGVHIDESMNIYFNTNSTVDYQLIASVFQSNLITNIEKETGAEERLNRIGSVTLYVNAETGSLTETTAAAGNKFKLVGDAINFAKSVNCRADIYLETDYPYCIVMNCANVAFLVPSAVNGITLHGLYVINSVLTINNIAKIALEPTAIPQLQASGITFGGYAEDSRISIPISQWATPETEYDATHKKLNCKNCVCLFQEITYYKFYNCFVQSGNASAPSTTNSERTGYLQYSATQ